MPAAGLQKRDLFCRVSENSNFRRSIGEHEKHADKQSNDEIQDDIYLFKLALCCNQIEYDEGGYNTYIIDSQICCSYHEAKNPGVSIKKDRNKAGSGKCGDEQCRESPGASFSQFEPYEYIEKQHREKQQFHMLPGGFVYSSKQSDDFIPAGPVIDKVSQRSQKRNSDCTGNTVL